MPEHFQHAGNFQPVHQRKQPSKKENRRPVHKRKRVFHPFVALLMRQPQRIQHH